MGWGCYKHEMDANSVAWNDAEFALCDRKLSEQPRTFGRDGRVCPTCYEELEAQLAAARAEAEEARAALCRVNESSEETYQRWHAQNVDLAALRARLALAENMATAIRQRSPRAMVEAEEAYRESAAVARLRESMEKA